MKSSFKERLERLGPVQAVSQVVSGSPVVMSLRHKFDDGFVAFDRIDNSR
jgi:hypothetical protein